MSILSFNTKYLSNYLKNIDYFKQKILFINRIFRKFKENKPIINLQLNKETYYKWRRVQGVVVDISRIFISADMSYETKGAHFTK